MLLRATSLRKSQGRDLAQIAQIPVIEDIQLSLLPNLRYFISEDIKALNREHDLDADRIHACAKDQGVADIETLPITLNSIYMRAGSRVQTDYYLISDKGEAHCLYSMPAGLQDYNPDFVEIALRQSLQKKMPEYVPPAVKLETLVGRRTKGLGF